MTASRGLMVRNIVDSRGEQTVEVDVIADNGL
jgi:enolase